MTKSAPLPSASYPGVFITFEGGDSCGKSTQVALLQEYFAHALGHPDAVIVTREPGGTPLGEQLRALLLHGPDDIDERCEALIYAADRAYHVATKVRPALASGRVVLADRYLDSSVAYQGAGRGLGTERIRALSEWAVAGLYPDLTFIFDLDPRAGASRRGSEHDRLERESTCFHDVTRAEFQRIAATYPQRCVVIDAAQPIAVIAAQIREIITARGLLQRAQAAVSAQSMDEGV